MLATLFVAVLLQDPGTGGPPSLPAPVAAANSMLRLGNWVLTSSAAREAWPTFGNGSAHTGYVPDVVLTEALASSWTATLPGNLQQVAVGDGRVYATPWQYFSDAWLAALDEDTGAPLWSYSFANCYSINPPTFADGEVYVQRGNHGSDTDLWSFDAASGLPTWIAPHAAQWERYMAPTVANERVWINGGYYGGMYGFEQEDGAELFFQGMAQYDGWTPSYFAGRVYSWVAGVMREHDQVSGMAQWSLDLGWDWSGWTMGRTTALANSRAFVVGNPNLYAIDLSTHSLAWSVDGDFNGTPAVANGVVYAMLSGNVNAYDAWDGHFLGVYPGESGLLDQPIVTDDALLFASATKTFVYDRASFVPSPPIEHGGHLSFANGRLYIATAAGQLLTYTSTPSPTPAANLVAEWEPWMPAVGNTRSSRVSIANHGALASSACRVSLWLSEDTDLDGSDLLLRSVTIAPLDAGEVLGATVLLADDPMFPGMYLLVAPDEKGAVPETNEENVAPSARIP